MKPVPPDKFRQYIRIGVLDGEFAGFGITALDYLRWYNDIIMSREQFKRDKPASVREMRQWIVDGAVGFSLSASSDEFTIIKDPNQALPIPLRGMLFPKKWKIELPLLDFKMEIYEAHSAAP